MKKKQITQITFSKELFIETMTQIEEQYRNDEKCSDAFKTILPHDHISHYDNHWLQNQLIKILQIAMNDDNQYSWIEYFMWNLDFGKKWKKGTVIIQGSRDFKLQSLEDLWELLNFN